MTGRVLIFGIILVLASFCKDGSAADSEQHSLIWKRQPGLISRWVDGLKAAQPLPEYPRPQMVRENWMNLNGEWDFLGDGPTPPELPQKFPEKALVPSATQAVTSCLEKEWTTGWYRKSFEIPKSWSSKKILVHFESVGGISTVYFNTKELGKNTGPFYRFTLELADFKAGQKNEILLHFDDTDPRLSRGKPDHVSGLWQSVWLEPVSDDYIRSFKQTPDIDSGQLRIDVNVNCSNSDLSLVATAYKSGKKVAAVQGTCDGTLVLDIQNPNLWSPESPFLYDLTLELKKGDLVIDQIKSYFGMREIESSEVDGVPRILLNNKVYYQAGLLDQGYWPESILTPPSDEALKWDIETAKGMGFNVLRKHVKVESARWYYWCDVLGILVWQDLPCQMYYHDKAHKTEEDKQFQRDALENMIQQFYNHPSIICWVIFNESWGQFEAREMTIKARKLDSSRLIDATSHVWPNKFNRQRYSVDFYDFHCYSRNLLLGEGWNYLPNHHLPHALGEFGGIAYKIEGHIEKGHERYRGYGADAHSADELLTHYKSLVLQACQLRDTHNLCAIIYTELTDHTAEINGFITYDRKVIKVDAEELKHINKLFTEIK